VILGQQEHSTELDEHMRARVREVLLKRHHHQKEKKRNLLLSICSYVDVSKRRSDQQTLAKPGEDSCRRWPQERVSARLWPH